MVKSIKRGKSVRLKDGGTRKKRLANQCNKEEGAKNP